MKFFRWYGKQLRFASMSPVERRDLRDLEQGWSPEQLESRRRREAALEAARTKYKTILVVPRGQKWAFKNQSKGSELSDSPLTEVLSFHARIGWEVVSTTSPWHTATLVTLKYEPAPQPVAVVAPALDIPDQLRKLAELKDQGIVTDEEFQVKKAELLARL